MFEGDELMASLPNSIFAEKAVLGSLLLAPESIYTVSQILTDDDFYKESHRRIYRTIYSLFEQGKTADLVVLRQALEDEGVLEDIGGLPVLMDLYEAVPSSANIVYYANILRDKAGKRRLIRFMEQEIELIRSEEKTFEEYVEETETEVFNAGQQVEQRGLTSIEGLIVDAYENIGKEEAGIPTFVELDKILGGLKRTDFIIVAARPGMGKTSFCVNIVERAATKYGCSAAFFSLEMSNIQLASRMLFAKAGVNQRSAQTGKITDEEWEKLATSMEEIIGSNIYIDDTPGITVAEVRGKCRRLQKEHGLDLIVIDYIQLMQCSTAARGESRQQQVSEISRQLKGLAKELNVPIIGLSQLSRAAANRSETTNKAKMPDLSHLRESGALEQDADIVLFIHRPFYYNPEENPLLAIIRVAKHRNGPTGDARLGFIAESATFRDMDFEHEEEVPLDAEELV